MAEELAVSTEITADAEIKQYTLVGDDIYVKRYTNENIPDWYRQLIADILSGDNTINSLSDAIAYIESWREGYNVTLSNMQNNDLLIGTKLETLKTSNDLLMAGVGELWVTKVDANSAQAIARDTVGAYFADGSAGAFFNNQISAYASAIEANAMDISTLSATLDGHTVSIDTVEEISLFKNATVRSATAPTLLTHPLLTTGDLWVNTTDNVVKSWSGTAWVDTTNTDAINATAASATALAKLVDLEEARDGNVVVYYETSTAIPVGMTYGDYMVDIDSWNGSVYTIYRYEAADGSSVGTLAWYVNTGETAKALSAGYRAQVLAGTAQSTADGKVKTWYQTTAPTLTASDIGDIWVDTDNANKLQVWSGTAWTDPTSAQGSQAYTWSANASKLITSPDGNITGWSFGDGTNTKSYFRIQADKFEVSNSTTGYTPFSISGTNVLFNGVVDFTNTNAHGTTTIDGGKITTGTITANQISAAGLDAGVIKAGVMYNTGGTATTYTMKIDLDNGEIHIR